MVAQCVVCESRDLEELLDYRALQRVTSDCKPWPSGGRLFVCITCGTVQKLDDERFRQEISEIYENYEIYKLSDGADQVVFDGTGRSFARSQTLVDFVISKLTSKKAGYLLDLGCGNGAALATFSSVLPGWTFDGSEWSAKDLSRLRAIRGFKKLHLGRVEGQFDVVTLIHALEHMVSPRETISEVADLLTPKGMLFIELPDVETSLFDVLIADHRTHFSRSTLRALVERFGLAIESCQNTLLPKEISMLAKIGVSTQNSLLPDPVKARHHICMNIRWLKRLLTHARSLAASGTAFGIFGTSISAMWMFGAMKDLTTFFIDEDKTRIGKNVEGRPVLAPQDAPGGSVIYVPLAPATAINVVERLEFSHAKFVAAPPIES